MSKLDNLRRDAGANVAESMGKALVGAPPTHGASAPPAAPDRWAGLDRLPGAQRVPVDRIIGDPDQPRVEFPEAELAELAASIRARGILQPIRVRWDEGRGMYVVIAGERRLRAARAAGLADAPCVIHEAPLSEAEILLDQLAENLVRLDLQPIEQARAFRRLMDAQGWSARRLAEELSIDHDKVNRAVRLLELPGEVQAAVAAGDLPPTTAYELSKLDDAGEQAEVAARIVAEGMTRADAVEAVRRRSAAKPKGKGRGVIRPRKVTERTFRTPGGPRVTIEHRKGLDADAMLTALEHAVVTLRAEGGGDREQAA